MIIPPYFPLMSLSNDKRERLWGIMRKHVTHSKCYATCGEFADAALSFLRGRVPKKWGKFRDSVTGNFRVINPRIYGL